MRRPPTLILIFLLLASSRVSGFKTTQEGDSSFVVFSSFPTFGTDGGGTQASTSHTDPTAAALLLHNEGESGHDGSSTSQHGVPLSISEVEGLGKDGDTTIGQDDSLKTRIFLFSGLMKDQQHQISPDAEEFTTLMAADAPTTVSDTTVIPTEPTAAPVIVLSEGVPPSHSSSTITHAKPPVGARASGSHGDKAHDREVHNQPGEDENAEVEEADAPVSVGSLASRLRRLKPSPRHSTKAVQQEQEKESFSPQMTLAERLKALQARRAERLGSQARRANGHLRSENITPQHKESPVQRRLGELTASLAEGETRQKTFSLTIEPKDTFTDPFPGDGGEGTQKAKEMHDLIGEEASLIRTTLPEQAPWAASPATSTTSSPLIKPNAKKPQRLSFAERLQARLQKLRERRLSSTTPRPRNPRPNNSARPRAPPRPKPEGNTRRGLFPRNSTAALTPSQRRRQELYKRLRNRSSTTRPPVSSTTSGPQEEVPATVSKTPYRRVPPRRLSFLPTTKRPLTLREKLEQHRKRNRFVPASKRKQTTSTTISTSTTTPATTPITTTQPATTMRTTPALAFNTWPVTPQPPTTMRTTPALAFNTWPVTPQPPTTMRTTPALAFNTWPVTSQRPTTMRTTPALAFNTWPVTSQRPTTMRTTPALAFNTWPVTSQRPTTMRTTPALAFNTWPVTQESDDDNLLVTVPSTTEASENSRRIQIRQMIDAMLSSKGLSGKTTTEQVLSFLEEATSRPIFMPKTESPLHSPTERSRSNVPLDDLLTTITESINLPPTTRPSTNRASDQPNLFRQVPSLADKLAGSHIPKKSKYHPSSAPVAAPSTPPTLTLGDVSLATDRRVTTLPELLADDSDLRTVPNLPHGMTEVPDTDRTTVTSEVEITTPLSAGLPAADLEMDDISPTTQASLERTTTEDQRVQNLISKLLAQGVITMNVPDDLDTVTPSMEDTQPTTTDPDTLPPGLDEVPATSRTPTKTSELDSHMSKDSEADRSRPLPTFTPPLHSEEPQLTRGAPRTRTPFISTFPFPENPSVSSVGVMDTTVKFSKDDTEVTEGPPITTTADTFLQTSPPHTQAEDSTLPDAGDLDENEIDFVNSKDNLHSLMRSLDRPSVRPELAAVNHVLGFSLTTDDVLDLVEVNIEKPQASGDDDTYYDDMETAATEQIMITTTLFRDEDLTSTPLNLDVTSLSVSEPSPQIHSATEATSLSTSVATSHVPTPTEIHQAGDEDAAMATKGPNLFIDAERGTAEPTTTASPTTTSKSPTMKAPPTPDAVGHQVSEESSKDKAPAPGSVTAVGQDALMSIAKAPQQPDSDNVTASLQKLLRRGASDKADNSPRDSVDAFQGVSKAVLQERLHLLRLVKEQQGNRPGHEAPPERLRTTSELPTTTSRLSLSELLNKRTSGEIAEQGVTSKPSISSLQPKQKTTAATEAPEARPVLSTTAVKQTDTQGETSNKAKTSDAMKRFLELNKHILETLRARNKASSTEAPTPPATSTPLTTASTTRHSILDLASRSPGLDNQGSPPVISEVTPQSQIISSGVSEEPEQPPEGTKGRISSFLRPALPFPQRSETSQAASRSPVSSSGNHVSTLTSNDDISHTVTPTVRSRILPPFRLRRPHPPTKFSLTRQQQQQADSPLMPGPSESTVETPKIEMPTTLRPLLQPLSTTHADDVSITDMIKPDKPSKDKDLDVPRTTPGVQSSEAHTERPNDDRFTTLASLLKRKHIPSTKFHLAKHKTTSLPTTTTVGTLDATTQLDDDTLAPVTLAEQEETTTIPQLPGEVRPNLTPQGGNSSVKVTDNSLRPPAVRGTFSATEGMTSEHVPPPLHFLNTNANFRTRLHRTSEGALRPGTTSFDAPTGVPLPLFTSGPPKAVFPTTSPAIKFELTPVPARFPTRGAATGLDTSATTDSPSSFPTSPMEFEAETETLLPPRLSLNLDTSVPPLGFNFQLHRKHFNPNAGFSPSSFSDAASDHGTLTTGRDTPQGRPVQAPVFTTTPEPGFASFTLGQNEAFFSDDEPKETTFLLPVTEIPVVTTPFTSVTPQVILLTLPVINGSVTAGSLLSDTTSTSISEEGTETPIPSTTTATTTTTTDDSKNVQPSEWLAPPPDIMHMITKGVTITSTEGIIDRLPPPRASVPQPSSHSLSLPRPTNPTLLHAEQSLPKNVVQKEDEELRTQILSESLPLLGDTEEKNVQGKEALKQQQQEVLLDAARSPNLQGGHLNLNEPQQHHLGGQVNQEGSQGAQTSSGLQGQQTDSQVDIGLANLPRQQTSQAEQAARGQHILHSLQNPPREQKVASGQHSINQHTVEEGRFKAGQHTIMTQHTLGPGQIIPGQHAVQVLQRHSKGQAISRQHSVGNQHVLKQGHVLPGQHATSQHTIEQEKGVADQHNTANQHTLTQGREAPSQHDKMNQHTSVQGEITQDEHNTASQHKSSDGVVTPGQQNVADQHTFVQGDVTSSQHKTSPQHKSDDGQVTPGQHNIADQHTFLQGQDVSLKHIINVQHVHQDRQQPAAQHNTNQHISEHEQGKSSQHTDRHQEQQLSQHNSQGQIIQDQQNLQGQITQGQHNFQGHIIQGQHNSQGQQISQGQDNLQDQHDIQRQIIQGQHSRQGEVIQAQHNTQDQHNLRGQIIPGQQNLHDQHNLQGQIIQGQHGIQGEITQHQRSRQEVIEGQHNTQGQHNLQRQVIQGQHNLKGQITQTQHNTQDQHDIQGQIIQGQHNRQGEVIQDQHNLQGQITQGQHNPQVQITHTQHARQEQIPSPHVRQEPTSQPQPQHSGTQDGHTSSEGKHHLHGHRSQGQAEVIHGQKSQGQTDVVHGQRSQGQTQVVHGQRSQGEPEVVHGQRSQAQTEVVHGQRSQAQTEVVHGQRSQAQTDVVHGQRSQGQTDVVHGQRSQGQTDVVHEQRSQGQTDVVHGQRSEGEPEVVHGQRSQAQTDVVHGQRIQGQTEVVHGQRSQGQPEVVHGQRRQVQDEVVHGQRSRGQPEVVHGQRSQGQAEVVHGQRSQGQPEVVHGQRSQGQDEVVQGQRSQGQDEVVHGQRSQGQDEVVHGPRSQGEPEVVHGQRSQGQPEVVHGQRSQGQDEVVHGQESQGQPEVVHGQRSQGQDEVVHEQRSQGQDEVVHGQRSQGLPEVVHGQRSQGEPKVVHGQRSQGQPEVVYGQRSQGQPEVVHGQRRQVQDEVVHGQRSRGQPEVVHGQRSQGQAEVVHGQRSQGQDEVVHGQRSHGQSEVVHGQRRQGQVEVVHGQRSQGQTEVVHGQATPEHHTLVGQQFLNGGQKLTVTQEQHQPQHDAKQHVTKGTQRHQVQHSSPPQRNSRRGKFISGDEVLEAQQVVVEKQGSRGQTTVHNIHGSRGTVIRGQSVVPPVQAEQGGRVRHQQQQQEQQQQQQQQKHGETGKNSRTKQHNARGQTREQHSERGQPGGGVQADSRGETKGHKGQRRGQHTRAEQQKVQTEIQREGGSPQAPTRAIGHFTNTAAGFLRGPANAFITGFTSRGGELPPDGGEGDSPSTLPPAAKASRGRLPLSHDSDGDEIPGKAGIDYPIQTTIPLTTFTCNSAMSNMMFADPDTSCQVYHVCSDHKKYSFLCPKGTLFNQDTSVCQWWFTVDCARQARRLAEVRGLVAG